MKSGFIHNDVLLRTAEHRFRELGAQTCREYLVHVRGHCGFIDLRVDFPSFPIACEAETTPRRIQWDKEKARAMGAGTLLILVPTGRVARACRTKAAAEKPLYGGVYPETFFLTLGAFNKWLVQCFSLISRSFETSKTTLLPSSDIHSISTQHSEL